MLTLSTSDAGALGSDPSGVRTALSTLLHDVERSTGHPPLADPKMGVLHGHGDGCVVLAREGDALIGVGVAVATDRAEGIWNTGEATLRPAAREPLARAAVDAAWEAGARRVQWWAFDAGDDDDALAVALGLTAERDLAQMRRPLPHPEQATMPEGVVIRSFVPGADDDEWLDVNRRAFAGHPEQQVFSRDDLAARMAEPWFDADDFLIAEATGDSSAPRIVGFCWVKSVTGPFDHAHGEIYVVGAAPEAQGSGLGSALVLAGLARMAERSLPEARLYVDGGNERAIALYERLGFTRHHVDRAYVAER